MRAALALVVLAVVGAAEARDRTCRWNRTARSLECGPSLAFFEFAPTSGAGMTEACACTNPTGAKGEALTFTRTGNATCQKSGLATTGIADGDLVVCAGNQPRVERDADGVRGLRVEGARTNSLLRSQELNVAPWGLITFTCSATIVTANAGTAPDGTVSAERVQIPACTGAGRVTSVRQTIAASQRRLCLYARSYPGAGAQSFFISDGNSAGNPATTCNTTEDSWSVCSVLSGGSGTISLDIGTNTYLASMSGGAPAADVLVWQTDAQDGTYCTSPIPTAGSAVTRNAEAASFTLPSAIGPDFAMGVSMWWPSSSVGAVTALQLGTAAPDLARIGRNTNTAATVLVNATTTNPAVSAMGTTQQRGTLSDIGGTRAATWQGASVAAPASSMTGTTTAVSIGALDGIVSKVSIDPARATP